MENTEYLNDLSYWFPFVLKSGVPAPATRIVRTQANLVALLDGLTPDGWSDFVYALGRAGDDMGWPCFLRSGLVSGKHTGTNSSVVKRKEDIGQAVFDIQEFACMVDFMGLGPQHVWAVRELLPVTGAFTHNGGVPINSEVRYFVEAGGGVIKNVHYWPHDAIRRPSCDDWREKLDAINAQSDASHEELSSMATRVAAFMPSGRWSVDFMRDDNGKWWCIDMAVAERSWGWA